MNHGHDDPNDRLHNWGSYAHAAECYEAWGVYVDPDGHDSPERFEAMSVEEKIQIQIDCFGGESGEEKAE